MIRILLILPFVVLAVYIGFSAFKYTRMISNIFMGLVYRPSIDPVSSVRGEELVILDSSDKEISALFLDEPHSDKLAIFCHESGGDKRSWEKYASFLPREGWRVLSVDWDEKWEGERSNALTQWPYEGDVERLLTVVRWARRAYTPVSKIVFFGVSKGANIALAASFQIAAPCAVIADGLFSMKEIFRDYIRKWAPILVKPNLFGEYYPDWVVNIFTELGFWHCQRRSGKKFVDVENLLRQAHAPVLVIHGETDDYVPASHQKHLHKHLSSRPAGVHWVAPRAGHNEAVVLMKDAYEEEIRVFLDKAFAP